MISEGNGKYMDKILNYPGVEFIEKYSIDKNRGKDHIRVKLFGTLYEGSIVNPDGGGTNNVSEGWNVINVPRILNPGEVCTITYFVIGHTKSMEIADNLITLLKTKFFRYMIMITISGMNLSQRNYTFVPRISDLSHPWNDDLLYKRYGLSTDEIEHIEKTIKPMETSSNPNIKLTTEDIKANYINQMINNQ